MRIPAPWKIVIRLGRDPSGATAIEYALLAALVAMALAVSIQLLGSQLRDSFSDVAENLNAIQQKNEN